MVKNASRKDISKSWERVSQNLGRGYPKILGGGIPKSWEDNNIIYNNIVEQDSTTHKSEVAEIINYLNAKANTNYKPTTKNTIKHINARLNEGYSVDDFKTVIRNKCSQWLSDNTMSRFLRPDTLFGTKFESYLNEKKPDSTTSFASGIDTWN